MLKLMLASPILLLAATQPGQAACDRYGNCYNSYGSGYQGNNYNTGSSWNSRSSGSNSYGTDSRGNSWSYNRNSGSYYNYGTGETRTRGQRW